MTTEAKNQDIMDELQKIREGLDFIKTNMVDVDMILTEEEKLRLEKARKEYKDGKTISLEELEKRLL